MKLYSDSPLLRTAQITGDALAIAAIVFFIALGATVHGLVMTLADFGRQLEGAGTGFQQTMADAADTLGAVPLIGGGVRAPFDSASDAGTVLQDAGRNQQELVGQFALLLAVLVALVPIALVLRYWLLRRLSFARRATAARTLAGSAGGLDLLALRALASRDTSAVLAIDPAAAAWRSGDERVIRALAALSLRESGVRLR